MALLATSGAAERLGTTERHIRELVYRRELPFVKVGRLLRFDPAALDRYVADRTVGAQAAP